MERIPAFILVASVILTCRAESPAAGEQAGESRGSDSQPGPPGTPSPAPSPDAAKTLAGPNGPKTTPGPVASGATTSAKTNERQTNSLTLQVKSTGDAALDMAAYLGPTYQFGFLVWPERWARWVKAGFPALGLNVTLLVDALFGGRNVLSDPLEAVAVGFLGPGAPPLAGALPHRDMSRPMAIALLGPSPDYGSPLAFAHMALVIRDTWETLPLSHRLVIPATDSTALAAEVIAYLEKNGLAADAHMAGALGLTGGGVFPPRKKTGHNYIVVLPDQGAVRLELVMRTWFFEKTDKREAETLRRALSMHPPAVEACADFGSLVASSPVLVGTVSSGAARAARVFTSYYMALSAAAGAVESEKWLLLAKWAAEALAEMLLHDTGMRLIRQNLFALSEDVERPPEVVWRLTPELVPAVKQAIPMKPAIPKVPATAESGMAIALNVQELCRRAPPPPLFVATHDAAFLRSLLARSDKGRSSVSYLVREWVVGAIVPALSLVLSLTEEESIALIPTGAVSWSVRRADGRPRRDDFFALRYGRKEEAEAAERALRAVLDEYELEQNSVEVAVRDDGVWLLYGPKEGLDPKVLGPSQELPPGAVAMVVGGLHSALGLTPPGNLASGDPRRPEDTLFLSEDGLSFVATPASPRPKSTPAGPRPTAAPPRPLAPSPGDSDCSVSIAVALARLFTAFESDRTEGPTTDLSQTAASALKELQRAGACASPGTPDEAVTKALFKAAKAFVDAAVKDLNDRRLEGPD